MPNKSDAPIEKVKIASVDLDHTKNPLVATIDTVEKKGISKQNMVEEANTSPISENNNIDTFDKREKSQTLKKTFPKSKTNKPNTLNSIDKPRSTQRTHLSNKSTSIEKPTKI